MACNYGVYGEALALEAGSFNIVISLYLIFNAWAYFLFLMSVFSPEKCKGEIGFEGGICLGRL